MELIESVLWIGLGFGPTFIALEVAGKKLGGIGGLVSGKAKKEVTVARVS